MKTADMSTLDLNTRQVTHALADSTTLTEQDADNIWRAAVEQGALIEAHLVGPYLIEVIVGGALVADLERNTYYLLVSLEGLGL